MATLETQYKNYLKENPSSTISYDEWISLKFSTLPPEVTSDPGFQPIVSDNFQIGPDGAFEYDEDDFKNWDITLLDGLDEELEIKSIGELRKRFKETLQFLLDDKEAQKDPEIVDFYINSLIYLVEVYEENLFGR